MTNTEPERGVQTGDTAPSTASFAEAENETVAPLALVADDVCEMGKLKIGAMVSMTFTVKLCVAGFPDESDARQVTVVLPNAKVVPGRGVQLTATAPSTASLADVLKFAVAPLALVA